MTSIRINGHRIPCRTCGRTAKSDFAGVHLCGRCFRAFSIGLMVGRCIEADRKEARP